MMNWRFSYSSFRKLSTVRPELQIIFNKALKISPVDFGISCGYRDKDEQELAFREGRSKLRWPESKHNRYPSDAVDFFPVVNGKAIWDNPSYFYLIAGLVLGIANQMGYKIRWGGAWNGELNKPGVLNDLPHIEWVEQEETHE